MSTEINNSEINNSEINSWLEAHHDSFIVKKYRYAVTFGWIGGEPWSEGHCDTDLIECVEVNGSEISFSYKSAWCFWIAKPHPKDEFGNKYIGFEDGVDLIEGFTVVGYADDSFVSCELDPGLLETIDDFQSFLDWCIEHTEHVSSVGDSGVSSGCAWSVTYWTADIPADSPAWAEYAQIYLDGQNGES
jgi:hypothetical protein